MTMTTTTTPGTIEHIDPQTIDVATNVRTEATLGKEFIDSIRANGVLQPVVAYRDSEGVHVRYGQRRTLAAQLVGLATMPVYVVDVDEADTAQRIIEQLVENDQREALGEADRLDAWRQLELEGLSATQIAKRTGTKRDKIKTGLTVASSDTGTRLVAEVGLTLDQAATLIEFEDDPETVAALTQTATENPGYFPVHVQRVRDERERRAAREAIEQQEAAKGHRILSERPAWNEKPHALHTLQTAEGESVSEADVQGKEGVAVHVTTYYNGPRAEFYVDDPEALGLTVAAGYEVAERGPMTDDEKAERKTLIANNKEWDAAETVRREWLTSFLARKTLPKNAQAVIAESLTHGRDHVSTAMSRGSSLAKTLVGLESDYRVSLSDYLDQHPNRATHVTLAIVLGGIEQGTNRETWRHPKAETARYLQTLAAWGHTLSPVERIAAMLPDED